MVLGVMLRMVINFITAQRESTEIDVTNGTQNLLVCLVKALRVTSQVVPNLSVSSVKALGVAPES